MDEEKKIVKPPFSFTIQLFFLMNLLILGFIRIFEGIPDYTNYILSGFNFETLLLSEISDFLLYAYAFSGIYKGLQRNPHSITILKLALFYIVIQRLFQLLDIFSGDLRYFYSISSLLLLFVVFFYVYLFKGKKLKEYIPSKERKFGLAGLVGILIYLIPIGMTGNEVYSKYYKAYKSLPKDMFTIRLQDGEYSDGLTIFTPVKSWECDSVITSSKSNSLHLFKTPKDENIIITTIPCRCLNRIDYYSTLAQCSNAFVGNSVQFFEIAYTDSIINGNRYYSNTYSVEKSDSVNHLTWTFSALISKDYYKMFTISGFAKDNDETLQKDIIDVLTKVEFNLEQRGVMNH